MNIDRRTMLKMMGGLMATPFLDLFESQGIKALAGKKGISFGSSVGNELYRNAKFRRFVLHHCKVLTPENQLKWKAIVQGNQSYNFRAADRLYDFCQFNHLEMRGHALIFEKSMTNWIASCGCDVEKQIHKHIKTLVARYENVKSWDLFNEISQDDGVGGWLRKDALSQRMGINYVKDFTEMANRIGAGKEWVVNEWVGPYKDRFFRKKRKAVLNMLEHIREKDIAIPTLGIQSHLKFSQEDYDQKDWLAFCKNCKDLGFQVKITELDVSHGAKKQLNNDASYVAKNLQRYLEDTLSFANVNSLVCWGLVDAYSYSMSDDLWEQVNFGSAPFASDYSHDILGHAIVSALNNCPAYEGISASL
ncbi:MAG: endo-1,4-beta-xylanase [Aliiglaciecola sp.]